MTQAPKRKSLNLKKERFKPTFEKIILHHTATKKQKKYDVNWCRKLHVEERGWNDIGYHIYIEYDGKIKMGRPLHKRGAHCLGENTTSIGICYVGGLDGDGEQAVTISPSQQKSVAEAIKALREATGKDLPVYSHCEFRNTFCPGFNASEVDWDEFLS